MRQDFVYLEDDLSLRRAVSEVQERLGARRERWGRYHVLFRQGDAYRCIPVASLSAELHKVDWSLDTPLTRFTSYPCAVRSEEGAGAYVREPFAVIEAGGRPVELEQIVRSVGAQPRPAGWWRLVGATMAELGQLPEWPDPLPQEYALEPVVEVSAQTTLRELPELLAQLPQEGKGVLAIQGSAEGEWSMFTVQGFADQVTAMRPQPAANSQVGALVDLSPVRTASLERSETPWELVEEQFAAPRVTQFLVTDKGRPAHVLSRYTVVRGGPIPKGVTPLVPEAAVPDRPRNLADFLAQLVDVEPGKEDYGRVVNTWFADQDRRDVPHTHALAANRAYHLGVNVGEPDAKSHVVGEQPAIGAPVVRYAIERGEPLTLRVDSEDFVVLDREKVVSLPQAGTTGDVFVRIATPVQTGLARLRLGVYVQGNLVQSYQVHARVAPEEGPMPEGAGDGWWSACEYTLSANFTNLKELRPRRVCVWVGEGRPETRRVGIGGLDVGSLPPLNVRLIEASLARYRELLAQSCVRETADGSEYLYQSDHTPVKMSTFERSLKDLAELGQMLYERVFGEQEGRQVARSLREIEDAYGRPLVVQIARLNLDVAFPWAVLYDRPLHYHPRRNEVCQQFADGDGCQDNCPHAENWNVICPYGFWGFRYVIEQPLRPPDAYTSVATRIQVAPRPQMALVYGAGLSLARYHQMQVQAIAGARADSVARADLTVYNVADDLVGGMKGGPAAVYLYCHGGNRPYRQWLVVGEDEHLVPTHLGDELRSAWEGSRSAPLVVLNGCHTGKYDPSTLLSFIHRFGALGAAGVVGTEIPIPELMGKYFGEFFIERFLNQEPVGQIVYDFRRELLQRRNVLGLVYVPYCYADLRIASAA